MIKMYRVVSLKDLAVLIDAYCLRGEVRRSTSPVMAMPHAYLTLCRRICSY